eukprot:CAMPEP_0114559754 /NCGR_PEP_ID=MMETSP0114-20121206/11088_1 /TAXON_ID=31324 /ORGANISM="Goniomonas sp, Strain m" /LENGTH=399 /DNA_ID=CAMNT_0001745241 /DNA_START=38 /DNA_END=1237 /DNA_ORIENTATION=+
MADTGEPPKNEAALVQPMRGKTFLTQKGTLGLAKMTTDEITEAMPEPATRSTQATQLVKARKQMGEVQELLLAKQQEFKERMEKCKEREEALSEKQEATREQVAKFAQFMKENDAKRTRALKRAQDEINIRKLKEKEAEELTQQIQKLEKELERGKATLERQLKYSHYLESVMDASEEFLEVMDILMRYDALKGTNQDLMNSVNEHNREMEIKRVELASLTKRMQSMILVQNSEVARHQQELDLSRNAASHQEQLLHERENDAKERIRLSGESQMAIYNLYQRTRNTHHSDSKPKEENQDIFHALKYIEQRFRDLKYIVEDSQKQKHDDKYRQHAEKGKADVAEKEKAAKEAADRLNAITYSIAGGGERKWSSHGSRSSQSDSQRGSTLRASTLSNVGK